jgi:hypothetical protein
MMQYLRDNPQVDAGIHLTHTAEWKRYRWRPLSGIASSPGLADEEGYLWNNVKDLLGHAQLSDIEMEIKAQIASAKKAGLRPSHLDTHMGSLWASTEYLQLYQRIGIEEHIPILLPAGHNTLAQQQLDEGPLSGLKTLDVSEDRIKVLNALQSMGEALWNSGLPVVDDLYILSYDWQLPTGTLYTDENIRTFKSEKYKSLLRKIKPGITVILIHCADANASFLPISDSWITRRGDFLAMTDSSLRDFIQDQKIVLTNWRELQLRREQLK